MSEHGGFKTSPLVPVEYRQIEQEQADESLVNSLNGDRIMKGDMERKGSTHRPQQLQTTASTGDLHQILQTSEMVEIWVQIFRMQSDIVAYARC